MEQVTSEYLAKHKGKIVIVFGAVWCKPCSALKPIVEQISTEYPDLPFFTVDVDAQTDIAVTFQVRGVPTILLATIDGAGIPAVKDRIIGNVNPAKIRESLSKL